jgi:hypothetical protein
VLYVAQRVNAVFQALDEMKELPLEPMLAAIASRMARTVTPIVALGTCTLARFASAMTLAVTTLFGRRVALRRDSALHCFRGFQQCLNRSTQIGHLSPKWFGAYFNNSALA